jgi:DNA invertase Pin-like site-specific DNA recombinase
MGNKQQRAALYIRVSTAAQNLDGQEAELKQYAENRGWTIARIYRDVISGAVKSRPALDELMADAHKRKVDVILCWKFDRFARSTVHLLTALEDFRALGIGFASVSEAIDTTTASGKLTFTVLGAVAELEKSIIRERIQMGVENAKRKGKRLGRPPIKKLSSSEFDQARKDRINGNLSLRALAKKHGTSVWTMHRAMSGIDSTSKQF